MYGLAGTVTRPPGSRRAIITPASAIRSAGHPRATPSAAMVARSVTRPEASMRPNPYTTSGRPGGLASGIGRPAPGLSCRRRPGLAAGMTGGNRPGQSWLPPRQEAAAHEFP
jgi:hypothetical protein